MQSYVINLIRHGAVDETLKGKYIGTTNVGLSKKGREDLVTIKETRGRCERRRYRYKILSALR